MSIDNPVAGTTTGATDPVVVPKKKAAAKPAFKPTKNQIPYAKPGEARRLEVAWQKFLATRPTTTVSEYKKRRPVGAIEEIVPCLLCGTETFKLIFHPRKKNWSYDVARCTECSLIYRNPNIIPEHLHVLYDSINYNNFLAGSYGTARERKYKSVLYSFRDLIPPSGIKKDGEKLSVLDFGCGNGLALEVMQDRGYETWGVDLSPESIEAAKNRLGHKRLWCGDPMEIKELEGKKFDYITMWSVLAHLPRPIDDLAMLRSFLKPGGAILVFTVNSNSLLMKQDRDNWNGFTRNHLAFYTAETANRLFKEAGYGEVFHRPHFSNHAGSTKKALPKAVWHRWQMAVLEHRGGNMNRMLALNPISETATDSELLDTPLADPMPMPPAAKKGPKSSLYSSLAKSPTLRKIRNQLKG